MAITSSITQKKKGLTGVSEETLSRLSQYESGYRQSDRVSGLYNQWEQLKGQKPGEYQSKYQQQLDALYEQLTNRPQFSYDLGSDALYQQYRDQYQRQGQLAMQDTMGQAAALTGGYGSSYAATAGSQAYQGYLSQLNDRVPELYQQAYQRYQDAGTALENQYALTQNADAGDYAKYRDMVGDYYTDLSSAYDAYYNENTFDYNQYANALDYWQGKAGQENSDYWTQADYEEAQRQYNQSLALQQAQLAEQRRQSNATLAFNQAQLEHQKKQDRRTYYLNLLESDYMPPLSQSLNQTLTEAKQLLADEGMDAVFEFLDSRTLGQTDTMAILKRLK